MDLSEFLLARIAEDETAARAAVERNGGTWSTDDLSQGVRVVGTTEFGNPRAYRGDGELWEDEGALGMFPETAAHIVRHDPARVLAECEAKRRILADHKHSETTRGCDCDVHDDYVQFMGCDVCASDTAYQDAGGWCLTVRALALSYADHPGYREEWRP